MSIKYTAIPTLTPVQFYKAGKSLPSSYHQKFMGDAWKYTETLGEHENRVDYAQPWQFNDLISIQVRSHIGAVNMNDVCLDILSIDDKVLVADIAYVAHEQLAGDIVNGIPVWVWQFKLKYSAYTSQLPQTGTNYVRFRLRLIEQGGPMEIENTEIWLSELQQFKAEQPDTHLVEYSNKHNKLETIFNQIDPLFRIRVSGRIHDITPGFRYETYEDDYVELNQIDDDPVEVYKYSFRDTPDYLIKKLNYILCCDRVRIDGKLFVKDEGASWELVTTDNHPVKGGTINVRRSNSSHVEANFENSFSLWEQGNEEYPKYLYNVSIFDGVKTLRLKEIIIENSSAGSTLATSLNSTTTATQNGTEGVFSYAGHALVYAQASGETWLSNDRVVLIDKLTLAITINIVDGVFGWKDGLFGYGIDWGDNEIENKQFTSFTSTNTIVQHQYTNTGNYVVRLFHAGALQTSYFNYPSDSNHNTHCTITNIAGTLPGQTYQFFINGNDGVSADLSGMGNASDWNFLRSAAASITNIILYNARISADIGQIFSGLTTGDFQNLKAMTLTNNQLDATQCGNVIKGIGDMPNMQIFAGAGVIRVKQKPPAVIVDSTVLSYIASFNALQWLVDHD